MAARLILAWLVHLYTALGAVVAFISVLLIEQLKFREAFFMMTLAVVIDASDGTLARAARVKELIPSIDGDRLEDIIDYFKSCETSSLQVALEELSEHGFTWEQLKLMRIKFLSVYGN